MNILLLKFPCGVSDQKGSLTGGKWKRGCLVSRSDLHPAVNVNDLQMTRLTESAEHCNAPAAAAAQSAGHLFTY